MYKTQQDRRTADVRDTSCSPILPIAETGARSSGNPWDAALHDGQEPLRVDVPAAKDDGDLATFHLVGLGHEGRQGCCARTLGQIVRVAVINRIASATCSSLTVTIRSAPFR